MFFFIGVFNLIVYRYLKTFNIMARFDLKFLCASGGDDFIKVNEDDGTVDITGYCNGSKFEVYLDKSTAIKFAKTLRTEINKIEG